MITILIYDTNKEYAARLGSRLAQAGKELEIEIVTERLSPAISDNHRNGITSGFNKIGKRDQYDFILTDSTSSDKLRQTFPMSFIWVLAETDTVVQDSSDGRIKVLYRYGPVSRLLALLREEYALTADKHWLAQPRNDDGARLICCFGLSGGCGASSVAIGLGREFAAYREKRTLYLSFEWIESNPYSMQRYNEYKSGDISRFLYTLFRKKPMNHDLLLESYLHRDRYGLERFYPSAGLNDILLLPDNEFEFFIKTLTENAAFDLIVFDLGNQHDDRHRLIASMSDSVILVESGLCTNGKTDKSLALIRDTWSITGQKILLKNMAYNQNAYMEEELTESEEPTTPRFKLSLPNPLKKDGFVSKRDESAEVDEIADDWLALQLEIPFDYDSFKQNDECDVSISGAFGAGIKQLADFLSD